MLIKQAPDIRSSEITDERLYRNRRQFIQAASGAAMGAVAGATVLGQYGGALQAQEPIPNLQKSPFSTDEALNSYEDITTYNNFYEFGMDKGDPARYADEMTIAPWSVRVEGEMNKPAADVDIDDILRPHTLEERIYRLRCVEAWSMVVPWVGFPLGDLIKRFEPTSKANFVKFTTLYRPEEMRGQRSRTMEWPYVEGLRMDEALNPLAIIAVGVYGKTLLNQQGPPLRLVVPWKYGFKSIKSIAKIEFVEEQPRNSWNVSIPNEYGFYSNVNPEVDHPRWSQARHRPIGAFFRVPTLMFNGYADQVASLYDGMDLVRNY
ncbi:MAG: protein-methionine-sulfoxide reductase catalytic subunit MsrP [Vicinamibacterales bacterium]|jgi:sulfoxide reductase catalytic subunit YedY|nr:protein-methionine-sulfoxide reductase catalytic subunit MsrP [Vicinamibacterales bacterium]